VKRLAIVTTHPIQYNAPLFRLLSERGNIKIKVFYTWGQSKTGMIYDPGFGKHRVWDIPLLEGYDYEFIDNIAKNPGSHHFFGIINPLLNKKIEFFNPDAILVYGWSYFSHLKLLRYYTNKIPIYFRGDSTLLDQKKGFAIKKYLRSTLLNYIYKYVDKALYVGLANKNYYLAYGLKNDQLIFAPHCIDNSRFYDNHYYYEQKAKQWRHKLYITDDDIVFLFAGKLEPKKNPFLLIEAFQSISTKNIKLIIVGNGILEKSIKKKCLTDKRIHFLDFKNQSQMPIVYRLGDVFVLPSKGPGETWGLAINEAMACGLPAIVSSVCGCASELIIEGETGYVFKSNDQNEIKNAILKMSDKRLILKMSQSALTHIRQFNLNSLAGIIEKVLLEYKPS
jgi:glycosyltransferase involved in cell wall biosynthesis